MLHNFIVRESLVKLLICFVGRIVLKVNDMFIKSTFLPNQSCYSASCSIVDVAFEDMSGVFVLRPTLGFRSRKDPGD